MSEWTERIPEACERRVGSTGEEMSLDINRAGKVVSTGDARDALALQGLNENWRKVGLVVALSQLAVLYTAHVYEVRASACPGNEL